MEHEELTGLLKNTSRESINRKLADHFLGIRMSLESFRRKNDVILKMIALHKKGPKYWRKFSAEEIIRHNSLEKRIPEIESEIAHIEKVVSCYGANFLPLTQILSSRISAIGKWQIEASNFLNAKR